MPDFSSDRQQSATAWRRARETLKKKKKRRGFLCSSFAGGQTAELILAQGDFVQTLLEQGRPFEALPFGQNCVLFLILLIFSKLWLSKMTWQVFPVTVGPEST